MDIIISEVPIEILNDNEYLLTNEDGLYFSDSLHGVSNQDYDYFTARLLKEYRISKENLYRWLFANYEQYDEDLSFEFFEYITSKIVSIQPNVHNPKGFELWHLGTASFIQPEKSKADNGWPIEELNKASKLLGDGSDAYSQFLIDCFTSIKNKLTDDKIISECLKCGQFYTYLESKKYCTHECRKNAENERYYAKYKTKLKPLKNKETSQTRQLYKNMGIKKG